ncbi:MAG TPA: DnaA/Hda family protein [Burkholderiales bacterium]|nr:DnaA/Hda family protein [Burkholderiales bacterium]
MQQLPLAISPAPAPTFGNFIEGANAEALLRVRELAEGRLREAIIYLWGEAGSGRSHLLRAAAEAAAPTRGLVVADDVQALDEPAQIALFNSINTAREGSGAVLAAGNAAPGQLALREDLRSRLGWGLVYQLRALSDEDKARHLRAEAERRGLRLPDEVIRYLLSRLPRDLPSLNAALELLDRFSLARQRPITLPLAREALKADDR